MPELPDIEAYLEALRPRVTGERLLGVRLLQPVPPAHRRPAPGCGARRHGAGRLPAGQAHRHRGRRPRLGGAALSGDPPDDRRAAALEAGGAGCGRRQGRPRPRQARRRPRGVRVLLRHPVAHRGRAASAAPPCIWCAARRPWRPSTRAASTCSPPLRRSSPTALRRENRTLKRALTDPHLLSGIGNAYSDEILHRACLSPLKLTQSLSDEEMARLRAAAVAVLREWTDRLKGEARESFPGEGDRVPSGHGRPRQVRVGLPGVRPSGAAHRLRRQRMRLLPRLPDRRPHPGRPLALAPAEGRLAARHARPRGRFRIGKSCSERNFLW